MLFLIESKIYGRNYHIEQYGNLKFLREKEIRKLGLITNHRIDEATRVKAKDNNLPTQGRGMSSRSIWKISCVLKAS